MRTTAVAVVTAIAPKMPQVKCSVCNVLYILDAYNLVTAINSRYYTHDDIRVHINGTCFAILASPPTTLWPGLQWVYAQSARTCTHYCLVLLQ